MAVSLKDPQDGDLPEMAEINVTPFIDVMLVLLIVFMVAAPLSTTDVAVDLPSSNAAQRVRPQAPVYLTVKADLSLALGEDAVARDGLAQALDARTGGDRATRIYLRADRSVAYGALMRTMNALRDAGYVKIALVAQDAGGGDGAAPAAGGAAGAGSRP